MYVQMYENKHINIILILIHINEDIQLTILPYLSNSTPTPNIDLDLCLKQHISFVRTIKMSQFFRIPIIRRTFEIHTCIPLTSGGPLSLPVH